jgi:hypothetical protein
MGAAGRGRPLRVALLACVAVALACHWFPVQACLTRCKTEPPAAACPAAGLSSLLHAGARSCEHCSPRGRGKVPPVVAQPCLLHIATPTGRQAAAPRADTYACQDCAPDFMLA